MRGRDSRGQGQVDGWDTEGAGEGGQVDEPAFGHPSATGDAIKDNACGTIERGRREADQDHSLAAYKPRGMTGAIRG